MVNPAFRNFKYDFRLIAIGPKIDRWQQAIDKRPDKWAESNSTSNCIRHLLFFYFFLPFADIRAAHFRVSSKKRLIAGYLNLRMVKKCYHMGKKRK